MGEQLAHETSVSTDDLRRTEFSRIADKTYVDHAGSALYSERQLDEAFEVFKRGVFGNPHSQNVGITDASQVEQKARLMTLALLNASAADFDCIFTSGATGAIKLVAECFPWSQGSMFAHSKDNHTSILGMRGVAKSQGASIHCMISPTLQELERVEDLGTAKPADHLLAYPLESNFNGARYDESLVSVLEDRLESGSRAGTSGAPLAEGQDSDPESPSKRGSRWWVLLDAAKACSTAPPDLSRHKPHFVALSFYKIFGYPTGLGALLVRKDAAKIMRRRYFGGGTVLACSAESDFVRWREGPAGFEDGTNSFLGIAALPAGFNLISRLGGLKAIQKHAQTLAQLLVDELASMQHHNGQALCQFYGLHKDNTGKWLPNCHQLLGAVDQGPTVALNLRRSDGSYVGYREVEKLAELNGIALRGGCLCNPGACAFHLGLTPADIQENFEAGKVCWDDNDVIDGRPTGVVRISFGMASTATDAQKVASFIRRDFLESQPPSLTPESLPTVQQSDAQLTGIWVYPIKSCGGCRRESWLLGPNGLLYDREWALVGDDGNVLTLGKHSKLALMRTDISLDTGMLTVSAAHMDRPFEMPLPSHHQRASQGSAALKKPEQQARVLINLCAESVNSMQMADRPQESSPETASSWFSRALGVRCRLVQQQSGSRASVQRGPAFANGHRHEASSQVHRSIGFANEAQLLVINEASLRDLNARLLSNPRNPDTAPQVAVERFRPNLVIGGSIVPYAEDDWRRLEIGEAQFEAAGPCGRCKVVCVDHKSGDKPGVEPLYTLASYRRVKGQINFGVLLQLARSPSVGQYPRLEAGMAVDFSTS